MKKLFLLIALFAFPFYGILQNPNFCGFDHMMHNVYGDSEKNENYEEIRFYLHEKIAQNQISSLNVQQPNDYIIPVVVHVLGDGESGSVTDQQILDQIQLLNDGFANMLGSTVLAADNAQIKFCLAQNAPFGGDWQTDYNSPTAGITRFTDQTAINLSNNHNQETASTYGVQALMNLVYFNPSQYMNIYIVNNISQVSGGPDIIGGYGYPAGYTIFNGMVMRADLWGANSSNPLFNQGRTILHEAGHYLSLFHTFHNNFACEEVSQSQPCNTYGDECCDTPPVMGYANNVDCSTLGPLTNSCSANPDFDMYENHMDYTYDNANTCRNTFTVDQVERMHAFIQLYYSNLVSFNNLLLTGVDCLPSTLNPNFVSTEPFGGVQFCSGDPYGFNSFSGATTYQWTFPGATFPVGQDQVQFPSGIVWNTPGVYTVSLTVTDGMGGSLSSSEQVFVSDCSPIIDDNAHWYFGKNAAIDFSSGNAQFSVPSSINVNEQSAAVSDDLTGNLVLYTDGKKIWDNTHALVNGGNLMNGSPNAGSLTSSQQGVVIVPRPGSNNYYIFPTSDVPVSPPYVSHGISQYEFDTGANQLVPGPPIHPSANYATIEPIVAIPHCNGVDYWIIVKPVNNTHAGLTNLTGTQNPANEVIAAYKVTNAGIDDTPVLSSSGPYIPDDTYLGVNSGWNGAITVSPDKKFVAFTRTSIFSSDCYLYYFNSGNGKFEYLSTLPGNGTGQGISFSPDSKILYRGQDFQIYQYDLSNISQCNPDPPFVAFSFTSGMINIPTNPKPRTMQLGPDNKIYVGRSGNPQQDIIAVINFPNEILTTSTSNECAYNPNGVFLSSQQYCASDLPNDIEGMIGPNTPDFSFCGDDCNEICFTNLGCGETFTWDFGDGSTPITGQNGSIPAGTHGGNTYGNFEYPCHVYTSGGSYTVTLTIAGFPPVSHVLDLNGPSTPVINGPTDVCLNSPFLSNYIGPNGNYTYSWNATNGTPATGNSQNFEVLWTTLPATLELTITDIQTGCSSTNTINVNISPPPVVDAGIDQNVCQGDLVTLSGTGAVNYFWNNGVVDGVPFPATVTQTYTVTGVDANGCEASDDVLVTVDNAPTISAGADLTYCPNYGSAPQIMVNSTGVNTYSWTPTAGLSCTTCPNPIATPTTTTTYTVTGSGSCTDVTDNVTVTVNCVCSNCNQLSTNGTLSSDPQTGQVYCSGDLTINGNVTIANCEIKMEPGATITVTSGSILIIKGSHIYSCKDMWNGIVVEPGGQLVANTYVLFSQNQASLRSNLIEDAKIAINILPNSPLTAGILTVENTVFNRNHQSIVINGYTQTNANYPFSITNTVFTCRRLPFQENSLVWPQTYQVKQPSNNGPLATPYINSNNYPEFGNGAYLKPPFLVNTKSYAAISMRTVGTVTSPEANPTWFEIQIGSPGLNRYNVFDNHEFGIFATNANFTSVNNVFQKTIGEAKLGGTAIFTQSSGEENNRANIIAGSPNGNFNNKFYDCHRAVYSDNYFEIIINKSELRSTKNLPPPNTFPPYERGSIGIDLRTNRFRLVDVSENEFRNIDNGIIFIGDHGPYNIGGVFVHADGQYSGQLNIQDNEIDAYHISNNPQQWTRNAITVSNVSAIAYPLQVLPGSTIDIRNNEVTDVSRGILLRNWVKREIHVLQNEVLLFEDPFFPNGTHFGVSAVNCGAIGNVRTNDITGTGNLSNSQERAIWVSSCNGWNVSCNTTEKTTNGIEFTGQCSFTVFELNRMRNHNFGFVLSNNGVIGQQGSVGNPSDNRWIGSWNGSFKTATLSSNAVNSPIYVRNPPIFNPDNSSFTDLVPGITDYSSLNPSIQTTSGPFTLCPILLSPFPFQLTQVQLMEKTAQDSLVFYANEPESKFIHKNKVYRMLKEEPALMDSSVILQDFVSHCDNSILNDFVAIEADISDGLLQDADHKTNLLTPSNQIEWNYQLFYEKCVKYQLDSINSQDSLYIIELAQACPFTDGDVVYHARALYNSIYRTNTYFENNCDDEPGTKSMGLKSDDTENEFTIYPNPGHAVFNIVAPNPDSEISINITSSSGQFVYSANLIAINGVYTFEPDLSRGVYFVTILDTNSEQREVKRLVIQ